MRASPPCSIYPTRFRKRGRLSTRVLPFARARSDGARQQSQLAKAATFIEAHAARGIVYVHCKIGYSRSAAAVAAWMLQTGRAATVDDAIAQLREKRPTIVIRPEIRAALDGWDSARMG